MKKLISILFTTAIVITITLGTRTEYSKITDSLKNAIDSGFCWDDTEEGEDYWFDIWKTLD